MKREVDNMPREKLDYRTNIARLGEMFPGEGMLTVSEAARWLKIDRQKVTALIRKGRLPAVEVGLGKKNSVYRIAVEALARFSA